MTAEFPTSRPAADPGLTLPEPDGEPPRTLARWERSFSRIVSQLERFLQQQAASSILLLAATGFALLLANSALSEAYRLVLDLPLQIRVGRWSIDKSLHHWVNEGLMTLFFFVVGLEIKREILVGELSHVQKAMLPVAAALGGMLAPALLYTSIVRDRALLGGWGIPMATDIAFSVGALLLLGRHVPRVAVTFLLALAIVDDIGALIVIAVFYASDLDVQRLAFAALMILLMAGFNRAGVRSSWPYLCGGLAAWAALLESGVHATVAGVATALTIPVLPRYDPLRFARLFGQLLQRYCNQIGEDASPLRNENLRATLQTMENAVVGVGSPLQRSLHRWQLPVAVLIMPLFAFANAGITVDAASLQTAYRHPVTQGVVAGLLIGKPLGITAFAWLGVRLRLCSLPRGLTFAHIFGVGLVAGMGFTMSLFMTELAFFGQEDEIDASKAGILVGTFCAAFTGISWLRFTSRNSRKCDSEVTVAGT